MIQAGDIVNNDGTGGESIYGEFFPDELHFHKHDKPYKLAMANLGDKDTNASQFYITLKPCGFLDSTHVVFGHVVRGTEIIDEISKFGNAQGKITKKVVILDCGQEEHPVEFAP